jgi:hypothetical protein
MVLFDPGKIAPGVNGQTCYATTSMPWHYPVGCCGSDGLCEQYGRGRDRSTFYPWYVAFELGDGFSLESLILGIEYRFQTSVSALTTSVP